MNSRERSLAILNHQPVDRLPFYDHVMNDVVIEHYAEETLTVDNGERVVPKALNTALDATRWIVAYPRKEEIITNPDGSVIEQKRWTAWHRKKLGMSLDEAIQFVRDDIRANEERDVDKGVADLEAIVDDLVALRDRMPDLFLFGNYGIKTGIMLYGSLGLENFSYILVDHPDLLETWLDVLMEGHLAILVRAERVAEFPAIFDCEDIASKNGPLFSPDVLRRYFFPSLERLVDAYHQKGMKFIFHSDGNLMPILDDLVATGIDGINPLEVIAGMDLKETRKRFPDLVMTGGVDCSQLLPFGTPQQVYDATVQAIRDAGPWYFPGSSSEVHNEIPLDNFKAMRDAIHETEME